MAPSVPNAPGLTLSFSLEEWFGLDRAKASPGAEGVGLMSPADGLHDPAPERAPGQDAPATALPVVSAPTKAEAVSPSAVSSVSWKGGGTEGGQVAQRLPVSAAETGSDRVVALGGPDVAPAPAPIVDLRAPGPGVRIMVQWQGDVTEAERAEALARVAGTRRELIHTAPMQARGEGVLEVIELAAGASLEGTLALYRQEAGVRYVEVDQRMRPQAVSNDPGYLNGSLWGMYGGDVPTAVGPAGTSNAFGSHAEVAWNQGFTGSNSVYVGIIDEGFEFTHPDLAANSWTNSFDPVDGIDNDSNGYVDDVRGWDFFNDDNSTYDGFSDDHGTHVAGTIGAAGGNGVGVSGVNWNVTMIATKFLGASGGFTSGAVKALDYLTDLKLRHGLNIVASNNSWGGSGYSQALHEAIIRAAKQNILFITAAGNSSADNDGLDYYPAQYNTSIAPSGVLPATYDAVVAVASISSDGALSSFSSYGSTTVDLGAPGSSILSTVPGGGYGYYSGTSMATPHVTGAVALYAAAYPGSTAAQIRAALLASTTPTPSLQGKTVSGGRLNLADLLNPNSIPSISLSVSPASVLEDGAANLVYTFSRTGPATSALTVNYGVGGSATLGVDYSGIAATPASKSVSFAVGQASVTVTVDPTADGSAEPDETVALTLTDGAGYSVGTAGAVVGTIQNDDYQVEEAFGGTKLVKDLANKLFVQVANNTPVSIKYGGVQVLQGGFAGWQTLGAETVAGVNQLMWKNTLDNYLSIWTMDSNWNWTSSQGAWGLTSAEALQQESNFQQDFNGDGIIGGGGVAAIVSLSVSPASVLEDGAANLVYTFSRTGSASTALTVSYGVGGSATLGVDYSGIAATPASKSVSFAAGQASVTVTVDPTADGEGEPDETVALTLQAGTGYTVGTAGAVVGTIQNDDHQVVEAFGGTKLIKDAANRLFAQVANNTPISIKYGGSQLLQGGFSGWETLGVETVAGMNQLMWKNMLDNYLSIWTMDSNWNWTSSQGAWGLTSAEALQQESNFQQDFNGDGIIGGGGVSAIVSLSVSPASVLEDGAANLVYTFSRTGPATSALTVNYGVGGSATLGVDYSGIAATPASKSVSFAAGQASVTVTVDPTADGEAEPNETVALTLQAGTGYTVGTAGAVVGTIQNDDYQVVEAFGGTKLVKDSANRFFAQVANNTPVSIKYGGSQVVQGGISGWETLGVETVAGVNQVMWKYTLGNSLWIWKLDGNWNWTSSQGGWGLNSAEALQQENIFQQDFNGNGIIGLGQSQNFTLPI